jgi:opacity protein-like surface antigen
MNYAHFTTVLAFSCAIPLATSFAQSEPAEPLTWSLSLGVDPTNFDLRTRDPGVQARVVGNLTRIWQSPDSRFSRKISLMLGGDSPRSQQNCCGCWERVGKRYAGLTAATSVDLFRASRFTPYLQSGLGIYYTRLTSDVNGVLSPSSIYDRNRLSFGVNGGLGFKTRLGSHEFFVEQMVHAFDVRALDKGVYPLNFGFRF